MESKVTKAKLTIAAESFSHECLDELQIPYRKKGFVISVTLKGEDFERFEKLLAEKMKAIGATK